MQVIDSILSLVARNPCMRVQAMAASCFEQFCNCEMISKKIFKNRLAALMEWLLKLCSVK